ncbi:phage head closure protein [Pigmentiphaga daeguensis]|uniref:Phage head-tail adaptor, putative, SPP1 family n=1 Tax=Pigmentiphaga daeguensis TaxID=414049 RepID=A0ABN1BBA9_9BURK
MNIGALNQLVTVQKRTQVKDAWGQLVDDWVDHATVWASFRAPTGMGSIAAEMQAGGTTVSRTQYSIRVRYRTDITADMRVAHAGLIYEIRQVVHDVARRAYTDLVCATGANEG